MVCRMLRHFSVLSLVFLLQGCAAVKTTHSPEELNLPEAYIATGGSESYNSLHWWEVFGSDELNSLQNQALQSLYSDDKRSGNFDLQLAYTRLAQSAANKDVSEASYLPSLTYQGQGSYSERQTQATDDAAKVRSNGDNYSASLNLSYELDLWGKVAARNQAADYRYQASYEDILAAVLSVSSNITTTYIDIVSARTEIRTLEEQIALNEAMVDIQTTRYMGGQITGSDLLQQQEQLLSTQAGLPALVEQERVLTASLALMLGELPTYPIDIQEQNLPSLPPLPEIGLPAQLIENRPDVRAAKLDLLASDKDLAIAKVGYLPNITLSASTALASGDLSTLLANWTASLLGSISGLVFDGGATGAEEDRLDAVTQGYVIQYTQTVATALNEVNNALMAENVQATYLESVKQQLVFQKALEEKALSSYLAGESTFLAYIIQLQALQNLETTVIKEEAELLKLRVNLYKALGIQI